MMDPVAFLRHILPPAGPYVLTVARGRVKWNEFAATVEELWGKEQRHDADPRLAVYHACASYREARHDPKGTPGPQKRLGRTGHNVALLRALWMDLDGGPGKPYPAGEDAGRAVLQFCQAAGLPAPVLVSSGNGCHAYWVLAQALPPDEWIRYAEGLKSLAVQHNLQFDPSRTADRASVLRTPGTHNRKSGVRPVRCGPLLGPYDIALFAKLLEQPLAAAAGTAGRGKPAKAGLGLGARPAWLGAPRSRILAGRSATKKNGRNCATI